MLKLLEAFFENAPSRRIVASEFLKRGFKVNANGKIFAAEIEISPVKIARALNVDRRAVIATANEIAADDKLLQVFYKLEPRAFIGNAARDLGFDSIELSADAHLKGIVAKVSSILAEHRVLIRQIITDDPDLFPAPVLTIVVDGKLKSGVIKKLKELEFAKEIKLK